MFTMSTPATADKHFFIFHWSILIQHSCSAPASPCPYATPSNFYRMRDITIMEEEKDDEETPPPAKKARVESPADTQPKKPLGLGNKF